MELPAPGAQETPVEPTLSRAWGRQILEYANRVYGLGSLMVNTLKDTREEPDIPLPVIGSTMFLAGLLRVESFNALESLLEEDWFAHAAGAKAPPPDERLLSADTAKRALIMMGPDGVRPVFEEVIHKAERNKVFREGWIASLRYVAIDGWEPICSYNRHCDHCLTREVTVGEGDKKHKVTQYYHRIVVALLLGPHEEVVLGYEPIRNADQRRAAGDDGDADRHEGELTAAKRLVRRLRKTYGRWLDVIVADGLYANGPFLTLLQELKLGAVIVAKKETDEPLKEALNLWVGKPPDQVVEDDEANERIELWDCKELQTLDTFKGSIRVTRAIIRPLEGEVETEPREWCFISIGVAAERLSPRQLLKVIRSRWHLENTGFNQWTQYWDFEHVYVTDWRGMEALFYFFFTAFNLLQLFVYRQVKGYARLKGTDPTKTIISLVGKIERDLIKNLDEPLAWQPQEELAQAA
jgi:Transposase DDE domain